MDTNIAPAAEHCARTLHAFETMPRTGVRVVDHLAAVAAVLARRDASDRSIAAAWLSAAVGPHIGLQEVMQRFGPDLAIGMGFLIDREAADSNPDVSRKRLAASPPWVQDVRSADVMVTVGELMRANPAAAAELVPKLVKTLEAMPKADPFFLREVRAQGVAVAPPHGA